MKLRIKRTMSIMLCIMTCIIFYATAMIVKGSALQTGSIQNISLIPFQTIQLKKRNKIKKFAIQEGMKYGSGSLKQKYKLQYIREKGR